jgi:hypothetical protein
VDWVTGAELVFDPGDLAVPPGGNAGWLLGDDALLRNDVSYFPPWVLGDARTLATDPLMRAKDGVTFVKRSP